MARALLQPSHEVGPEFPQRRIAQDPGSTGFSRRRRALTDFCSISRLYRAPPRASRAPEWRSSHTTRSSRNNGSLSACLPAWQRFYAARALGNCAR
jgi:hypothetical protein